MTDPIDSTLAVTRSNARRVKSWRIGSMTMCWVATGLVQAAKRFRRVKCHAALPALVQALANNHLIAAKDAA